LVPVSTDLQGVIRPVVVIWKLEVVHGSLVCYALN